MLNILYTMRALDGNSYLHGMFLKMGIDVFHCVHDPASSVGFCASWFPLVLHHPHLLHSPLPNLFQHCDGMCEKAGTVP